MTILAEIARQDYTKHGVFGALLLKDDVKGPLWSCYTLEEEWKDNEPRVSSVPTGSYICKRTIYHRYGYETFEVTEVEGRSRILFHPGNTEEDTEGCIIVGLTPGRMTVVDEESNKKIEKRAVLNSKKAFDQFMNQLLGIDEFKIRIYDWRPE